MGWVMCECDGCGKRRSCLLQTDHYEHTSAFCFICRTEDDRKRRRGDFDKREKEPTCASPHA